MSSAHHLALQTSSLALQMEYRNTIPSDRIVYVMPCIDPAWVSTGKMATAVF